MDLEVLFSELSMLRCQTAMIAAGLIFAFVQLSNWKNEHIGSKQIDLITEIVEMSRALVRNISHAKERAKANEYQLSENYTAEVRECWSRLQEQIHKLSFMFRNEVIEYRFVGRLDQYRAQILRLEKAFEKAGKGDSLTEDDKHCLEDFIGINEHIKSSEFHKKTLNIEADFRKLAQETLFPRRFTLEWLNSWRASRRIKRFIEDTHVANRKSV